MGSGRGAAPLGVCSASLRERWDQGRLQRPFFIPRHQQRASARSFSVACGPRRAVRAPVCDARRGGPRRDEERAPLTPRGRRAGRPSVQQTRTTAMGCAAAQGTCAAGWALACPWGRAFLARVGRARPPRTPTRRARPTRRVSLRSQAVRLSVHWCATRGWARFRVRARRVLRALRTPRPPGCALGPSHSRASALAAASRIRKRRLGRVQPHAAEERLERASREPPRWGRGGRPRQKASPGRRAHDDQFCVTTSTSTATLTTWTRTSVRWFPPPIFRCLLFYEKSKGNSV